MVQFFHPSRDICVERVDEFLERKDWKKIMSSDGSSGAALRPRDRQELNRKVKTVQEQFGKRIKEDIQNIGVNPTSKPAFAIFILASALYPDRPVVQKLNECLTRTEVSILLVVVRGVDVQRERSRRCSK